MKKIEIQIAIENELERTFIRINFDEEKYDIFIEINKMQNHITESTKKLTKKYLIVKISKRLLEL